MIYPNPNYKTTSNKFLTLYGLKFKEKQFT